MQRPLRLKDNYEEQMKSLRALCEQEELAKREVSISLTFTYQGSEEIRARTLAMKDRIEAALKQFGLVYTMMQDPESSFPRPIFFLFLAGPARTVLSFYEAIGKH